MKIFQKIYKNRLTAFFRGDSMELSTKKEFVKMKKIIGIILAIVTIVSCVVAFAACSKTTAIGVQAGTTGEAYVKGDADWGFAGVPNSTASSYENVGLAVNDMKNGNIKYVIVDKAVAQNLVELNANDIKMIDVDLTVEKYAIGVNKEKNDLKSDINTIIADLKENGTLDAIYAAYDEIEISDDEETGSAPAESTGFVGVTSGNASAANKLIVATNAAFAPYEYKIGNKFYGIDMEIAKIIAETLDLELVIDDMDFAAVVTSVQQGSSDIALACLTVNAKRALSVNFTDAYEEGAAQVLIVKKDDTSFDACTTAEEVMEVFKNLK